MNEVISYRTNGWQRLMLFLLLTAVVQLSISAAEAEKEAEKTTTIEVNIVRDESTGQLEIESEKVVREEAWFDKEDQTEPNGIE